MVRWWCCVAGVASARDAVSWHSSAATHLRESARAFFAIVAQVLLWYGVSSLYWVVCLGGSGESTGPCRRRFLLSCVFTGARVADCADKPANWWKNLFLMATGTKF